MGKDYAGTSRLLKSGSAIPVIKPRSERAQEKAKHHSLCPFVYHPRQWGYVQPGVLGNGTVRIMERGASVGNCQCSLIARVLKTCQ